MANFSTKNRARSDRAGLANYGVEIKSIKEQQAVMVHMGTTEYLMAKRNTTFKILLHNKSKYLCDVSVSVNQHHVGTWRVNANSTLTITKNILTGESFMFDNTFHHVENGLPAQECCHESSIVTQFIPTKNIHLTNCRLENDGYGLKPICDQEIDWDGVVFITIPVLICDHNVQ